MITLVLLCAAAGWLAAAVLSVRARARVELVARASHELRGPLTAAQLALDAMAFRGEVSADRALALEAQLRRARLALDDLVAAPVGDRAPDSLQDVSVAGFVAQLALTWAPVVAARGRELQVAPVPPGLVLYADRTRLAQAAGNLVANALEHGAGPIDLRTRWSGRQLRIEVRDGGAGLPAPVADLTRRPRGPRGRGLAIAAAIAERHGGRLTSAPSAAGAAVVLELPIHDIDPDVVEAGS